MHGPVSRPLMTLGTTCSATRRHRTFAKRVMGPVDARQTQHGSRKVARACAIIEA